jgi:hypothetical protein
MIYKLLQTDADYITLFLRVIAGIKFIINLRESPEGGILTLAEKVKIKDKVFLVKQAASDTA